MIQMYSKSNCPNCDKAKALLQKHNVEYTVIDVDENDDDRNWLISQGHRSVPQIYKDGELYVKNGYQGLVSLYGE